MGTCKSYRCQEEHRQKDAEIMRLKAALVSVGILNTSGGHYDAEIDKVIREVAVEQ